MLPIIINDPVDNIRIDFKTLLKHYHAETIQCGTVSDALLKSIEKDLSTVICHVNNEKLVGKLIRGVIIIINLFSLSVADINSI